jgi:hypothetical protein
VALRDKLRERTQRLLQPGEEIQHVFLAQAGPDPNFAVLAPIITFFSSMRVIAATDRAVVVMSAGTWKSASPIEVLQRLPRETEIGPVSGTVWSATKLPGERTTYVHRRFYKDVQAADAARNAPTA